MVKAAATSSGGGEGADCLGITRRLASSDKKVRDKAVELLAKWLECRDNVQEGDLKIIWKGLFYCYWHTDKSAVQNELATNLADLVPRLKPAISASYFDVFMVTILREWGGIDHLRLDKFYLLVRKFISAMFKAALSSGKKFNRELVGKFMDSIRDRALLATDLLPSRGASLHLAEVYLEELRPYLPISAAAFGELIKPFEAVLAQSSDKTLLKRVRESIFYVLLKEATGGGGSNLGSVVKALAFDDRFFRLAAAADTPQANRGILYWLQAEFKKLKKVKPETIENPQVSKAAKRKNRKKPKQVDASEPGKDIQVDASEPGKNIQVDASEPGKNIQVDASEPGENIQVDASEMSPVANGGPSKNKRKKKKAKKGLVSNPSPSDSGISSESPKGKRKTSPNAVTDTSGNDASSGSAKKKRKNKSGVAQPVISNLESKFDAQADEVPPLEMVMSPLIVGKKKKPRRKSVLQPIIASPPDSTQESFEFPEQVFTPPMKIKKRKQVPVSPINTASKKRKSPAADETPEMPSTIDASSSKKKKKVRFALKKNTIWKPSSPGAIAPENHRRSSPKLTPKGSALKRGVPAGPIRISPKFRISPF